MEKREKLVSIVIPVYNISEYLTKCLDTLIQQTYRNMEILLIDDGSEDGSREICRRYEEKDQRVKMYVKENGGVSSARNLGIRLAVGEYIAFVDGDDFLDSYYVETLVRLIETDNETDASAVSMYRWYSEDKKVRCENGFRDVRRCTRTEVLNHAFDTETPWVGFAWGKMYRLDMIKKYNIQFDEGIRLCEDSLFNYQYFDHARFCRVENTPLYYYRIRQSSVTGRSISDVNLIATKLSALEKISQITKKYRGTEFEKRTQINRLRTYIYLIGLKKNHHMDITEEEKKEFQKCVEESRCYQSRNDRIKLFLLKLFPTLLFILLKKRMDKDI